MTTTEAAQLLGISARQVQRLTDNGTLRTVGTVGRSTLLDTRAAMTLSQQGGTGRGRKWHETTVWAALALLDGHNLDWYGTASRRWHVRARLAQMTVEEFVRAGRSRAHLRRFRASASFLGPIAEQLMRSGLSAMSDPALAKTFGLAAVQEDDSLDGYLPTVDLDVLVRQFRLVDAPDGNLTVRTVTHDRLLERGGMLGGAALALDLAESLDPRLRTAGMQYLRTRLAQL